MEIYWLEKVEEPELRCAADHQKVPGKFSKDYDVIIDCLLLSLLIYFQPEK
jgi:hypothetical protein